MGRRRSPGDKPKKHKRVTIDPAERMHAGKVIAPYRIMEELIKKVCGHLDGARIAIAWRKGWPAVQGRIKLGQMKMANDCDRAYKDFDFLLLLNSEVYRNNAAGEESLTMTLHHLLLAGTPDLDRDGNQKIDEKDRKCWKIRKPPIVEFPEIIQTYGLEKTIGLTADAIAAINDSARPLLPVAENVPKESASDANPKAWRRWKIKSLEIEEKIATKLSDAGFTTLGNLFDHMKDQGIFWAKKIQGVGGASADKVADAFTQFWGEHPEFCGEEA